VQRLGEFIREVVLTVFQDCKAVILIDEIDSVLGLPFPPDDLFGLLRSCHQRSDHPEYRRLTFGLFGVATPTSLIQDKISTPFNIGKAIPLEGFRFEEARGLAQGLVERAVNPEEVLRAILDWTGGQPFLTQKLCQLAQTTAGEPVPVGQEQAWVRQLVQAGVMTNWEAQDEPEHLRTIRNRLLVQGEKTVGRLLSLYQEILQKGSLLAHDGSEDQAELRLSGLVVKQQDRLQVFNPIYREIFNLDWVNQQLANLRDPFYAESFNTWLASGKQDTSCLLRGEALQKALEWKTNFRISRLDEEFLDASQQDERQAIQRKLAAEAEAKQILEAANRQAQQRIRLGSGVLAVALGTTALAGMNAHTAGIKAEQLNQKAQQAKQETEQAKAETTAAQRATAEAKKQTTAALRNLSQVQAERDEVQVEFAKSKEQLQQTATQRLIAQREAKVAQQTATQAQASATREQKKATQAQVVATQAQQKAQKLETRAKTLETRVASQSRNLGDILQISEAVVTFAQGKPQAAIEQFTQILTSNPQNSWALVARGEIYLKSQQVALARQDFEQAITLDKQLGVPNPVAYFGRGNALLASPTGQPEAAKEAVAAYDQAIKLKPDYYQAWTGKGNALARQEQWIDAIKAYHQALTLQPKDATAVDNLKACLNQLLKGVGTITTEAVSLGSSSILPGGQSYGDAGRLTLRGSDWRRMKIDNKVLLEMLAKSSQLLLRRDPEDADAFLYQGITLSGPAALEQFDKALKRRPDSPLVYFWKGNELYEQNKLEEAVKAFNQAIALNPQDATAYNNLGIALSDQNKLEEAVKAFNQAIALNPQYATAYNNLGIALSDQNKLEEAVKAFNQAIALNPQLATAYNNLGIALHQQGKLEEAKNYYEKAVAQNQELILALFAINNIGLIQYELGQAEEAIRHWQTAARLDPNAAEPRLATAVALYHQGNPEQALALGAAALRLDSRFDDLAFLKKNLWGDRLLAAAKVFLNLPQIRAVISDSQAKPPAAPRSVER
jgi:tetratricopeptide (TPR) repeat protein